MNKLFQIIRVNNFVAKELAKISEQPHQHIYKEIIVESRI
jgi:hypothetical protein